MGGQDAFLWQAMERLKTLVQLRMLIITSSDSHPFVPRSLWDAVRQVSLHSPPFFICPLNPTTSTATWSTWTAIICFIDPYGVCNKSRHVHPEFYYLVAREPQTYFGRWTALSLGHYEYTATVFPLTIGSGRPGPTDVEDKTVRS